ncbi:MAG: cohesin domain-containing protein, partial [Candidatus Poribacteria bacterium]|nr:cohesin domain-containing protein [Candidatus Poribacteria bacterium]
EDMRKVYFTITLLITVLLALPALVSAEAVISIDPAEIELPDIGDTLSIDIKVSGGNKVAGWGFVLAFDATVLEFGEAKLGDYLPAGAFPVPPIASAGKVNYAATSLAGVALEADGILATITFNVLTQKGLSISFDSADLSDSAAKKIPSTTKGATVKVATSPNEGDKDEPPVEPVLLGDGPTISVNPAEIKSPAAGESLAVEVNIAGGENVAGFQFTLTYDETALEFVGIEIGNYLPASAFPVKPTVPLANPGSVPFAATAIGAKAVKSSGTLAAVTFKVLEAKASDIGFKSVQLSDPNALEIPSGTIGAKIIIKEADPVIAEREEGGKSLNLKATIAAEGPVNLQTAVAKYEDGKVAEKGTFIEYQVKFGQDSALKTGGIYIHTDKGNILGPDGEIQAMRLVEGDSKWAHNRISLDPIAGEKIVAITAGTKVDSAPKGLFSMLVDNIQLTDGEKIVEPIWLSTEDAEDQGDLEVYGEVVGVEDPVLGVQEDEVAVEPKDKMLTSWGQIKAR